MYEGTDTMENPPTYLKGDIVWVKLSGYWWPGEVKNEEDLPSDLLSDFKKPPLVVVKFFDEDSYEYIKHWSNICPYNCDKKNEFIKKGMAGFRGKLPHMAKFPKDIGTAEEKTNGNPNILSQPEFLPPPKINFDEIFGSSSPKKSSKSKLTTSASKKPTTKDHNRLITHRRFLGNDDYKTYVLPQFPGKDRAPDSDDEEIQQLNQEPQETLKCPSCSFNTKRLGVLLMHSKMHSEGIYTVTKRKSKKAKDVETINLEGNTTVTKSPKSKQRKKKEDVTPKSAEVFANLLEEWKVSDDEMDDGETPSKTKKQSTESKEIKSDIPIKESTKSVEENKLIKNHTSAKDLTSPSGGFHDDIKNCFDFDEEEEGDFPLPALSGRKIPRVIPEKPKASISELLEMSHREDELAIEKISGPKDESNKQTTSPTNPETDVNKKEILRISQSFNISVDDSIENSFKELMEETEVPVLDNLTQTLKPEQNFHDARTIKFPDKGGTTLKEGTSHKGGTSKKRFITSFEDFEAGFRKIEGEERNRLTGDKEDKWDKKTTPKKDSKKHHKQTPTISREKLSQKKTGLEKKGLTETHCTETDVQGITHTASNTPEQNLIKDDIAMDTQIRETINTEGLTLADIESKRKYRRRTKQFVVEEDSEEIIEFTKEESDKYFSDAFKGVVQSNEEPIFDAELEALKKDLENSQNVDSISQDLVKESERTKVSLEQLTRDLEGSFDSADVNMVGDTDNQLESKDQKKTAEIEEQVPTESEILVEESTKKKIKQRSSKDDTVGPKELITKNRRGRSRRLKGEFDNSKFEDLPKSSQMEEHTVRFDEEVNRTESKLGKEQKESITKRKSAKDKPHMEHFGISSKTTAKDDRFLTKDSKMSTREGEEVTNIITALEQKSPSKRGKRRKHDEQSGSTIKDYKFTDFIPSEEVSLQKRKNKRRKHARSEDQTIATPENNFKDICENVKDINYFSSEQTVTVNSMEADKEKQVIFKSRKTNRRKYVEDVTPESVRDVTEIWPVTQEFSKSDKTRRSKDERKEQILTGVDKSVRDISKIVKSSKTSELPTKSEGATSRFITSQSAMSQENPFLTAKSRLSILATDDNADVSSAQFSEAKVSKKTFKPPAEYSPNLRRGSPKKSDKHEDLSFIETGTPPEQVLSKSTLVEETQASLPSSKEAESSSIDTVSADILNWNSEYVIDSMQYVPDTNIVDTPKDVLSEPLGGVPETPLKPKRRKTRWNTDDDAGDDVIEVTSELKSASNADTICISTDNYEVGLVVSEGSASDQVVEVTSELKSASDADTICISTDNYEVGPVISEGCASDHVVEVTCKLKSASNTDTICISADNYEVGPVVSEGSASDHVEISSELKSASNVDMFCISADNCEVGPVVSEGSASDHVAVSSELKSASNVDMFCISADNCEVGPVVSEGSTVALDKLSSVEEPTTVTAAKNDSGESGDVTNTPSNTPVADCSKSIVEEAKSEATAKILDPSSSESVPGVATPPIVIPVEKSSIKTRSFEEVLMEAMNKDLENQTSKYRSRKHREKNIDVKAPENIVDYAADKIRCKIENNQKEAKKNVSQTLQKKSSEPTCYLPPHIMDKLVKSNLSDRHSVELSPRFDREKEDGKHKRKSETKAISIKEIVPESSKSNVEVSNSQRVDITSKIDSCASEGQFTIDSYDSKDHASSSHHTRRSKKESYRSRSSKYSKMSAEPNLSFADLKELPLPATKQPKELLIENIEVPQISKDVSKDETSSTELTPRKSDVAAITGIVSDTIYGRKSKNIRSSRLKPSRSRWDVVLRPECDRESTTPPLPSEVYTDHAQQMPKIHEEPLEVCYSDVKGQPVQSVTASSNTFQNEADFKTKEDLNLEKEKISTFFLESSDVAGQPLGDETSKVYVSEKTESDAVTHQVKLSKEPIVELQNVGRVEAELIENLSAKNSAEIECKSENHTRLSSDTLEQIPKVDLCGVQVGEKFESTDISEVSQVVDTDKFENTCQPNMQLLESSTISDEPIIENIEMPVPELQEQMQQSATSSDVAYVTKEASLNLNKSDKEPIELQEIQAPGAHAVSTDLGEDHAAKSEGEKQLQPLLDAIAEIETVSSKSREKSDVQAINEIQASAIQASNLYSLNTDLGEEHTKPLQSLLDAVDETKPISLKSCGKSDATQVVNEEGFPLKQDDIGVIQESVSDSGTKVFDDIAKISSDKTEPVKSFGTLEKSIPGSEANQLETSIIEESKNICRIETESAKSIIQSEFNALEANQLSVPFIETSELKCSNDVENTLQDSVEPKLVVAEPKRKIKQSSKSPAVVNLESSSPDIVESNSDVSAQEAAECDIEIIDLCKEEVPHPGQVLDPSSHCKRPSMSTEDIATITSIIGAEQPSKIVLSESDAKKTHTETELVKSISETESSIGHPIETIEEFKDSKFIENAEEVVEPQLDVATIISGADAERPSGIISSESLIQKSHVETETVQTLCELESSLVSETDQVPPANQIKISEELIDSNDIENSMKNAEVIESKLSQPKKKRGRPSRRSLIVDYEPSASDFVENIADVPLPQEPAVSEAETGDFCKKESELPCVSTIEIAGVDTEQSIEIVSSELIAKENQIEPESLKIVGETESSLQVFHLDASGEVKDPNDVEKALNNAGVIEPKLDVAQPEKKHGHSSTRPLIGDYELSASNIVENIADVPLPPEPVVSETIIDDFFKKEGELSSVSMTEIPGVDTEQSSQIVSSEIIAKESQIETDQVPVHSIETSAELKDRNSAEINEPILDVTQSKRKRGRSKKSSSIADYEPSAPSIVEKIADVSSSQPKPAASGAKIENFCKLEGEPRSLSIIEIAEADPVGFNEIVSSESIAKESERNTGSSKAVGESELSLRSKIDEIRVPSLEVSEELKDPKGEESSLKNTEIIEPKLDAAQPKRKRGRPSYKLSALSIIENIADVSLSQPAASKAKIDDFCKKEGELPSMSTTDVAEVDPEQFKEIVSPEGIAIESETKTESSKTVVESELSLRSAIDELQGPSLEVSEDLKDPKGVENAPKIVVLLEPKLDVAQPKRKRGRPSYKLSASNIAENVAESSKAKIDDICDKEGELSSMSTIEVAGVDAEQSSQIVSSEGIAKENQIETESSETVGESESSLHVETDPPLEAFEKLKGPKGVENALKNAEIIEPKLDAPQPKKKRGRSSYKLSASNIVENTADVSLAEELAASEGKVGDFCKKKDELPSVSTIEIVGVDPEQSSKIFSSESIFQKSQIETGRVPVHPIESPEELKGPNDIENVLKNAEAIKPKLDVTQPKRKRGRSSKRSSVADYEPSDSNIVENIGDVSLAQEPAVSEVKIDGFSKNEFEMHSGSTTAIAGVDTEQSSEIVSSESVAKEGHVEIGQVPVHPEGLKDLNDGENASKMAEAIEPKPNVAQPKRKRGRPSKSSLITDYKPSVSNIVESNTDVLIVQKTAESKVDFCKKEMPQPTEFSDSLNRSELSSMDTKEAVTVISGVDEEYSSEIVSSESHAKKSDVEAEPVKTFGELKSYLRSETDKVPEPPIEKSEDLKGSNDVEVIQPNPDVSQPKRKRGRRSKSSIIADKGLSTSKAVRSNTDVLPSRETVEGPTETTDFFDKGVHQNQLSDSLNQCGLVSVTPEEIATVTSGIDTKQSNGSVSSESIAQESYDTELVKTIIGSELFDVRSVHSDAKQVPAHHIEASEELRASSDVETALRNAEVIQPKLDVAQPKRKRGRPSKSSLKANFELPASNIVESNSDVLPTQIETSDSCKNHQSAFRQVSDPLNHYGIDAEQFSENIAKESHIETESVKTISESESFNVRSLCLETDQAPVHHKETSEVLEGSHSDILSVGAIIECETEVNNFCKKEVTHAGHLSNSINQSELPSVTTEETATVTSNVDAEQSTDIVLPQSFTNKRKRGRPRRSSKPMLITDTPVGEKSGPEQLEEVIEKTETSENSAKGTTIMDDSAKLAHTVAAFDSSKNLTYVGVEGVEVTKLSLNMEQTEESNSFTKPQHLDSSDIADQATSRETAVPPSDQNDKPNDDVYEFSEISPVEQISSISAATKRKDWRRRKLSKDSDSLLKNDADVLSEANIIEEKLEPLTEAQLPAYSRTRGSRKYPNEENISCQQVESADTAIIDGSMKQTNTAASFDPAEASGCLGIQNLEKTKSQRLDSSEIDNRVVSSETVLPLSGQSEHSNKEKSLSECSDKSNEETYNISAVTKSKKGKTRRHNKSSKDHDSLLEQDTKPNIDEKYEPLPVHSRRRSSRKYSDQEIDLSEQVESIIDRLADNSEFKDTTINDDSFKQTSTPASALDLSGTAGRLEVQDVERTKLEEKQENSLTKPNEVDDQALSREPVLPTPVQNEQPSREAVVDLSETSVTEQFCSTSAVTKNDTKPSKELDTLPEQDTDILSAAAIDGKVEPLKEQEPKQLTVRGKRRTSRKYSHQESASSQQAESVVDRPEGTLKVDSAVPEAASGKSAELPVKKGRGRPRKYSIAEEKTCDAQPQEIPSISVASLQEPISSRKILVDFKQEPSEEKEKLVPPKKNRWSRRGSYNKKDSETVVNEAAAIEGQAIKFETTLIDKTDHSIIEAVTPDNSMTTLNDSEIILPPKKSKRSNEISSMFLKDSFSDEQVSPEKKHDDTLSFPVYDDSFMSTSLRNNIEGLIKEIDTIDNVTSDNSETSVIHKEIKHFNIPEFKMDKPNTDQTFASSLSDDLRVTFRDSIDIPKCVPPKKKKIEFPKEVGISVPSKHPLQAELSKTEEKIASAIPQAPKKKMQKLFENSQALEKSEKIDLPLMSPLAKKKSFLFHQEEFQQVHKMDDDLSQKDVDAFPKTDKVVDLPKDYTGSARGYVDDHQNLPNIRKRKASSYRDYPEKKDKLDQIEIPDAQTIKDSLVLDDRKTNVQSDQKIAKPSFNYLTNINASTDEYLQLKKEMGIKLEEDDSKSSIQTNLSDSDTSKVDELTILAAKALAEIKKDAIKQNFNASMNVVKVETVVKTEPVDTLLQPSMPLSTLNKPELIPISVTPTVMSEQDLADAQVEITRDKIISEKKPSTSSTFSIDFSESNIKTEILQQVKAETGGTEFTSKAMIKEFDNRSLISQPNAYVLKSELLDILEGNSNSSTNSSGSEQKFKTSFDNYDKKSTVQGIIDFEEAIPSQIVLSNKVSPESVLIDSPKLLERLSMSSEPVMVKAQKVIVQSDSKVPEGVLRPLMSKLVKSTGIPKPGQKIVIKTSRASSLASKIPGTKPIILSEQIIRPAGQSAAAAKAQLQQQGIKRQYEDIEDVEAAFIIPKIAKKVIKEEELDEEVPPTPPEKPTRSRGSKLSGKAKILQQTIITPKGEVLPQGTATTAAQAIHLQQVQVQQSQDDAVFDINSMPIVLSDDLLTPESIQNMPVVLSEDVLTQSSAALSTKSQEKLLTTLPKKIVSTTMGAKQIIFRTTQSTATTPAKHPGKARILSTTAATPQSKIARPGPTALLATGTTPDGKPAKYVLVPPSSISSASAAQVKAVKQAVAKKQQAAVQSKVVPPAVAPAVDPVVGNKIMIVTNAQGQQTRVVLTPQQQKAFMQSQAGSKTKTIIKGGIPKALLESAAAVAAAGPSGIPKTVPAVPQVAAAIVSTQGGLLMPAVKSVKTPAPSKKGAQRSTSKLQKTILIKNQLGQTVRKIQGTDDADLDRQVAEQLEAIKASARLQQANKSPEIINYTNRQIPTSNKSPVRRSFSRKVDSVKIKIPATTAQFDTQVQQEALVPALAPLSPQPRTSPVHGHSAQNLPKQGTARKIEPPHPSPANKTIDAVLQQQRHQTTVPVKSDSKHQMAPSKETESKRAESPLRQVVIQDGLGNLTTVTVGQILAIPSETVDGQPQSYMLVTVDESGNLTPLNNDALMSLDPSLGAGGDINNMVLHVDQGQGTVAAIKSTEASVSSIPAPSAEEKRKVEERLKPEPPKPPQPVKEPKAAPKLQEVPISVEQQIVIGEGVLPGDAGGQQLIVTGDPIATQKFLESLSDGSTDLANILANAEGGSVLIQADGQQILIRTNPAAQPLMGIAENTEGGGNPIFGTHKPNQDILAAALANTDVFQPTDHQHSHSSPLKGLQSAQLSPGSGALYPMHVSNVLETSLTLGSPIMTPLEVPSTNSKKIDDEIDILSQVPKNVDLPITITDPNITQTVAHQQAAALMDLSLPISETGPSGDINSTCIYPLSSLDVSVNMLHKPFGSSMPLLTEDVGETDNSGSTNVNRIRVKKGLESVPSSFSPTFGSLRRLSVSDSSQEEVVKNSPFGDIGSLPMLSDDVIEDSGSSIGSMRHRRSSPKLIERDIIDEGLSTLGGEMCSSLSEPPPDMFDLSSITHKGEETSSDMSSIPEPETLSMNSENSGEIPIQPPIVATLSDLKRSGDESEGSDDKRPRFD